MFSKRFVKIYSYSIRLLLLLMFYTASPIDWDVKKRKIVRTHGIVNLLFWGIFIAITTVCFALTGRLIIRFFSDDLWDPLTTSLTVGVYCGGLGLVSVSLFDFMVFDTRELLVEFANQILRLDKRLQRK